MKNKYFIIALLSILFIIISCGPRRYKCGPYRKCNIFKEKLKKEPYLKEYKKIQAC